MKVLVQRVLRASVDVDGRCVGSVGCGLLLFVGFRKGDDSAGVERLAEKAVNLRIFEGGDGRLAHSVVDVDGEVLAVPQFTLYADTRRGRRPDFICAMPPDEASRMFDEYVFALAKRLGKPVSTGVFGANMTVSLVNDGPFTIMLTHP